MRYYLLVLIIINILIISTTGCIKPNNNDENVNSSKIEEDYIEYKLEVNISTSSNNSSYELILPLFILPNGTASKINEYLSIRDGNANIDIIDTIEGPAYYINASRSVLMGLENNNRSDIPLFEDEPQIFLSLENLSLNEEQHWTGGYHYFWIFLNTSEMNIITLSYHVDVYGTNGFHASCDIVGIVKRGWYLYRGIINQAID
jgi:hypothetical protein